jgi:hypothetical protein
MPNKYNARSDARRANKEARDKRIKELFQELYNGKRLRIDDCYKAIADRFFLSKSTVEQILRAA